MSARPDWRDMPRQAFDVDAPGALFDLAPDQVPADDDHGTGDMLALLRDPA